MASTFLSRHSGKKKLQMRVIDTGSGYLCQMEPVAHFGLGSKSPSSMTIEVLRWPDGVTRSFDVSNQ